MRHEQGRKALILLTDGVDTSSRRPEELAIEACLKADTAIYSVCISDDGAYGPPGRADAAQ